MAIVDLASMKAELGILDSVDDALITSKIEEAQGFIESMLGYKIADEFPTAPPDLAMAVSLMAAHLYENREATAAGITIQLAPLGVDDVIRNRRRYSFGG